MFNGQKQKLPKKPKKVIFKSIKNHLPQENDRDP